ncbi:LOW QUALITY PROTEIN: bifunctional coenzyme A synthase [Drosophila gunungcola]|uniref:LOW QUALITY PROTEIN: bifunctional coenzyme A synthase n=1 Tax=Drosophila gunungcola TaxID=103775 RepID=UPI0022E3F6AF|nr:LOW QUALITY PROTEIN: bifunctional coenzyme A synthase [Drosophila gunungcola]
MASTGLLVVSNIKQLGKSLRAIEKYVNSLYIHLNVAGSTSTTSPNLPDPPVWGRLISQLYANSSSYVGNQLDLRVLVSPLRPGSSGSLKLLQPVDLIFSDAHHPELCDKLRADLNISKPTIFLEDSPISNLRDQQDASQAPKMYPSVVLGGTFDRIHLGHKIFLTQAVLRTCKRLVVGVTTPAMTKGKTLPDLILPVKERIARLRHFLMDIDSTLQYEIVPIDDPFGPTQVDPDLDMIVVSAETLRGGQKVNEIRSAKQLRELEIFVIDIVESNVHDGIHETKVSSSNTRIDLLGTRWRRPDQRPQLPSRPHIIGLTGGIASGKSKMAERLGGMGAHVIDCDKVAHDVYEPGQVCYERIVQHFGKGIVAADGRIDRSKLGPLVFADPKQLQTLNGIVWPELIAEVNRRLDALRSQAEVPRVVVLEAAILLRAGWESNCHEIWSMIVTPEEAVRRIVNRNNLSEEEARKRLSSQVPNTEIVAKSHVIFSSQWDHDFTQKQAERAWRMLTKELDSHQSSL